WTAVSHRDREDRSSSRPRPATTRFLRSSEDWRPYRLALAVERGAKRPREVQTLLGRQERPDDHRLAMAGQRNLALVPRRIVHVHPQPVRLELPRPPPAPVVH